MRPSISKSLVWTLATIGLTALLYAPTWHWLAVRWWYDPNYGHAFLVLPVALSLVGMQRKQLGQAPRQASFAGLLILEIAIATHLVALIKDDYLVSALTIPAAVAGLIWFLHGLPLLKRLWFPVFFLVLMTPFPWGEGLDVRLHAFTTTAAGEALGLLGVKADVLGAQISLAGMNLEVGAACSNFRPIMPLLTVGTVITYLLAGPRWAKMILALTIVPIALTSNLVRLVSFLLVAIGFGAQAATDYYHFAAGMIFFLCTVSLFMGAAKALGCSRAPAAT